VDDEVIGGLLKILGKHFVCAHVQVNDIADTDVDDTEEALVLLLELLLVEDLNCQNAVFCHSHVKHFIPIRVQGFSDDGGCPRLFPGDGRNGERVGKAENISFVQAVSRNNCAKSVSRAG
jgi:hypothetical protein